MAIRTQALLRAPNTAVYVTIEILGDFFGGVGGPKGVHDLNLFGATCGKPIRYFWQIVENRRVGRHVAPLKRRLSPSQLLTSKTRGLLRGWVLGAALLQRRASCSTEHEIYTSRQSGRRATTTRLPLSQKPPRFGCEELGRAEATF